MFERSQEYLDAMSETRLVQAISANEERLAHSKPATEPFETSVERLRVFVPEAVRRGLTIYAGLLMKIGEPE